MSVIPDWKKSAGFYAAVPDLIQVVGSSRPASLYRTKSRTFGRLSTADHRSSRESNLIMFGYLEVRRHRT